MRLNLQKEESYCSNRELLLYLRQVILSYLKTLSIRQRVGVELDVITLGETMVLFTPETTGPLRYVHTFNKTIGGAESNFAIALTRLGHEVGWISRLGNDEFGLYIRNFIRGEGVDTSRVIFDQENPTAVFFKENKPNQDPNVYYYRKQSAASAMKPSDLDEEYFKQAKYLHITGVTPALSDSCKATIFRAIELAKKHNQTIVFDPNIRLKLWSKAEAKQILTEIAKQSDIILPGLDEGELITGESTPERVATSFEELGAKLVVIKLGAKGAYFQSSSQGEYVRGYEVEQIVDTVGAGDGFAAGLLAGLLKGWDTSKSVKLANRIGAYALSVNGDVEGYPFWYQVNPDHTKQEISR